MAATAFAMLTGVALATPVSVRIVGDGVGVERNVDTTAGAFGPVSCPGDSAGGAIEKAVDGNWDRQAFVSTILGETHTYGPTRDYWNFWINDTYSQSGICDYIVNPGDRVLMLVQRDTPTFMPNVFPLGIAGAPANAVAGAPFTVSVREFRTDGTTTAPAAAAGATVEGGGATAQTDAGGRATIVLADAGTVTLRATRAGNVASDAATVSVTAAPVAGLPTPPAGSGPVPPQTAVARDTKAPGITIRGITEGRRFARGKGPRRIQAVVDADSSGLLQIKLRLTRTDRGRCTYFSGKSERFKPNRKGRCSATAGYWFGVGDKAQVDYLLPSALPRGRYVLDFNVIDRAYNRDDRRRRGANRVVFHVG